MVGQIHLTVDAFIVTTEDVTAPLRPDAVRSLPRHIPCLPCPGAWVPCLALLRVLYSEIKAGNRSDGLTPDVDPAWLSDELSLDQAAELWRSLPIATPWSRWPRSRHSSTYHL